jgi:hypothetical protein
MYRCSSHDPSLSALTSRQPSFPQPLPHPRRLPRPRPQLRDGRRLAQARRLLEHAEVRAVFVARRRGSGRRLGIPLRQQDLGEDDVVVRRGGGCGCGHGALDGLQGLLDDVGFGTEGFEGFVGRAADGGARPVLGVPAGGRRRGAARGVQEVDEGLEGEGAGEDNGEGGVCLGQDGVGNIVERWV